MAGKIRNLEDLKIWQKARKFTIKIYRLIENFPRFEKFNLTSQIRRATTSVPANIAEGFGRYHFQESIQFYRTSRGSLMEVKNYLCQALDLKYMNKKAFDELVEDVEEIHKMLNGLTTATRKVRR